jgi:hypothetical protein
MQERLRPLDDPPSTSDFSSRLPHHRHGRKAFKYPIFKDLTKDSYNLLQTLLKEGPIWTSTKLPTGEGEFGFYIKNTITYKVIVELSTFTDNIFESIAI